MKVVLQSSTVVLHIQNAKVPKEGFRLIKRESSTQEQQPDDADYDEPEPERLETLTADIKFKGLGLSVVDQKPQELLYLTVQDLHFEYSDSNLDQAVTLSVDKVQVDDQSPSPEFAVVLCQTPINMKREMEKNQPKRQNIYFSFKRLKSLAGATGVEAFQYFTFLLQEMDVEVSET